MTRRAEPTDRPFGWVGVGVVLLVVILVPFVVLAEPLDSYVRELLAVSRGSWPTAVILGGLLAGDIFLPIPSSIVSVAAGHELGLERGALTIWIGATAGNLAGYLLARAVGPGSLSRIVGPKQARRAGDLAGVGRGSVLVVAVTRAVPVLGEATVLLAGATRMPFPRFLAAAAAGNLTVAIGYACIGAWAAAREAPWLALGAGLALPAVAGLTFRALRRWTPREP